MSWKDVPITEIYAVVCTKDGIEGIPGIQSNNVVMPLTFTNQSDLEAVKARVYKELKGAKMKFKLKKFSNAEIIEEFDFSK